MCSVAQSCPTLCDPMDCSLPGSSVHVIFQARILEWVAMPSFRGSSYLRDQTRVSPELAGRFFTTITTWKALDLAKCGGGQCKITCPPHSHTEKHQRMVSGWGIIKEAVRAPRWEAQTSALMDPAVQHSSDGDDQPSCTLGTFSFPKASVTQSPREELPTILAPSKSPFWSL